jgi:hypothetical protein
MIKRKFDIAETNHDEAFTRGYLAIVKAPFYVI